MMHAQIASVRGVTLGVIALALTTARPTGAQVSASVFVPVPSPYLPDWAVKPFVANLTVINNEGVTVTATVRAELVQGRGAIVGVAPSDIVDLPPTPSFFSAPQMARWTEMVLQPSLASIVQKTGRLPEGPYTLCMSFTNMSAGGGAVPDVRSCSPTFNIAFPAPPVLVAPGNASTLTAPFPTFQWTPVVTPAVPIVSYRLRVVEVLPGQTPLQAIDANVPLFEPTLPGISSFIYPPSAYPLEVDHTYAWRVQALKGAPGFDDIPAPVGANDGKSEVFVFTKKAAGGPVVAAAPVVPVGPPPTKPPPKPPVVVAASPGTLTNASLSGKLEYTFSATNVPTPKWVDQPAPGKLPIMPMMEQGQGKSSGAGQSYPMPTMPMVTPASGGTPVGASFAARVPLTGVTVRLVVRYRTNQAFGLPKDIAPAYNDPELYKDENKVIATAVTGANGSFAFLFHDDRPTGNLATLPVVARFYQIEVGDGHFLNPADELTLPPSRVANVGTVVTLVRFYRLTVRALELTTVSISGSLPGGWGTGSQKFEMGGQFPTKPVGGIEVQLLRRQRLAAVPKDEGPAALPRKIVLVSNPGQLGTPYEVIGEAVTNDAGYVTFTRLVKNLGPGDQYRLRAHTPDAASAHAAFYETVLLTYPGALPGPKPADQATFNEQYPALRVDTVIAAMQARKPRLTLLATRADAEGVAIGSAAAYLCRKPSGPCLTRVIDSTMKGKTAFSDVTPGDYTLHVFAAGFEPFKVDLISLVMGAQEKVLAKLVPNARIVGRLVDEKQKPYCQADVWAEGGAAVPVQAVFGPASGGGGGGGGGASGQAQAIGVPTLLACRFEVATPAGKRVLHVQPGTGYFPYDTTITVAKGVTDVGTIKLARRAHRLELRVVRQPGGKITPGSVAQPVAGAVVQVMIGADESVWPTKTADQNGVARLEWIGGSDHVDLVVRGPASADYVTAFPTLTVVESPTYVKDTVGLKPGTRVSGRVYAGAGSATPVDGAHVTLAGDPGIQAYSNAQGEYVLRGVPLGARYVRAAKSKSPFIGDSIAVTATATPLTGVDFHLQFYEGIDITTLLGFPMEVWSLVESATPGQITISGALVELPANAAFKPLSATGPASLPFDPIAVQAVSAGDKHAVPVAATVVLATSQAPLGMFGTAYAVKQYRAGGLELRPRSPGVGGVYGAIALGAFPDVTGGQVTGVPDLHVLAAGANGEARTVLASLTADAAAPAAAGFNIGTATGGSAKFSLLGFATDADSAASFITPDAIHLHATLHTAIPGVTDLKLVATDLQVVPGTGLKPVAVAKPITTKLELWTLSAAGWSLEPGAGKVLFGSGHILAPTNAQQTAGGVTIPFTWLGVKPATLEGGGFSATAIMLGGIVPVQATALTFGWSALVGHWMLAAPGAANVAKIAALPGMRPSDEIWFDAFQLYSNATSTLSAKPGSTVRFYQTADFLVQSVGLTPSAVQLWGTVDPNVPDLAPAPFQFTYTKGSGSNAPPVLNVPALAFAPFDIGGPQLTLNNGTLNASGFHSSGTLGIQGKFTIDIAFTRSPLNAPQQVIQAVPTPAAQLKLGDVAISQLKGGATSNSPWKTAIDGVLGIGDQVNGPVHLDVAGTDVAVGTSGLTVKRINTPFGGISLNFNFPEQRLEGSLSISHELTAGATAQGTGFLAISGKSSDPYWVFFFGGGFELKTPHLSMSAAILIGDGTMPAAAIGYADPYFAHGVPQSFNTLSGFIVGGKVELPIPQCPNLDLEVAGNGVKIECTYWAQGTFGMNFAEPATVYHIGLGGGVHLSASGGVGIGLCVHVSGGVDGAFGIKAAEFTSNGDWYVVIGADLSLYVTVSGGVGIDDYCIEKSTGKSVGFGAEAQLGHNWNSGQGPHFDVWMK